LHVGADVVFAAPHTMPQPPQWLGSVIGSLSHPSPASRLQSKKPPVHDLTAQPPSEHAETAFRALQLAHEPLAQP